MDKNSLQAEREWFEKFKQDAIESYNFWDQLGLPRLQPKPTVPEGQHDMPTNDCRDGFTSKNKQRPQPPA